MLWFKIILLVFLLAYPMTSYAEVHTYQGNGRIGFTDDPSHKDMNFNDSSWLSVPIPGDIKLKKLNSGVYWLRVPFHPVFPTAQPQNLSILFSGIGGKYHVYFNGQSLGQGNGIISSGKVFTLPAEYFKKTANVLAIRITTEIPHSENGIFGKIYYGNPDSIIRYRYHLNTVYLSLALIFLMVGLIAFFAYRKTIRNYFTLLLGTCISAIAFFIFLKSFSGLSLFSSVINYIKITEFLSFIILPSAVLFLNRFYKIGFNKLDIVFFSLLAPCVFIVLFLSHPVYLKYVTAFIVVLSLIPAIFYSMAAIRKILKSDNSGYFFITGMIAAYGFIIAAFFLKKHIFYLNILHLSSFGFFFSAGFFYHYFSLHSELVENKYLLERRLLESSVIVDDQNESNVDLIDKMKTYEDVFMNAIELAKKTLTQFNSETPCRKDVDFSILSLTSKKLSGDYFKVIPLKDGLRFVVIDFPGDEIGALVLNLVIEYEMKTHYKLKNPSTVLKKINESMNLYGFNVLLSVAVLDVDPVKKSLKLSGAGFPEICLIRNDEIQILEIGGIPLGLDDYNYTDDEYDLSENTELVVFTDGIMHQVRKHTGETFADFVQKSTAKNFYHTLSQIAEQNKNSLLDDVTMLKIQV